VISLELLRGAVSILQATIATKAIDIMALQMKKKQVVKFFLVVC
jgi:ribosomal silencing factor RsfS